jgi:hypothetical protein
MEGKGTLMRQFVLMRGIFVKLKFQPLAVSDAHKNSPAQEIPRGRIVIDIVVIYSATKLHTLNLLANSCQQVR